MRTIISGFALAVFLSALAQGQNNGEQAIDKVLSFNSTDNRTVMQEICNAIRAITEIPAGLDVAARTLTLHGTSDRVEVAEWLLVQFDQPVAAQNRPVEPVTAGKSLPGIKGGTEIVDILYSGSDYQPRRLQETVNTIRAITELVRLMPVNPQNAVVLRGPADRVALAAWIFTRLEGHANPTANAAQATPFMEYRAPLENDPSHHDTTRIFFLSKALTPQELQNVVNQVRASAQITRLMPENEQRAIVMRASDSQLAEAEQLIQQLNAPPGGVRQKLAASKQ